MCTVNFVFIKTVFVLQVKALKEKIESERGKDAFPVAGQKLIYAGNEYSEDNLSEPVLFYVVVWLVYEC